MLLLGLTVLAGVVGLALVALFTDRALEALELGVAGMFLVVAALGGVRIRPDSSP